MFIFKLLLLAAMLEKQHVRHSRDPGIYRWATFYAGDMSALPMGIWCARFPKRYTIKQAVILTAPGSDLIAAFPTEFTKLFSGLCIVSELDVARIEFQLSEGQALELMRELLKAKSYRDAATAVVLFGLRYLHLWNYASDKRLERGPGLLPELLLSWLNPSKQEGKQS